MFIANAMKKVSGAAVSVYDRNGSYHFEEEISAIKCVSFEKHGDTYELHEDEATAVSEILSDFPCRMEQSAFRHTLWRNMQGYFRITDIFTLYTIPTKKKYG